jgi:Domain of Unknown Function (DUF1080)
VGPRDGQQLRISLLLAPLQGRHPLRRMKTSAAALALLILPLQLMGDPPPAGTTEPMQPLFTTDGVPKGWRTGLWSDVSKPAPEGVEWTVKDGVLHGGRARGCWLISDKEYADFILTYEFKLGPQGNSGCALRAPAAGDPAFDGLEMQMADFRYNEQAKDSELTGGLYRAAAPSEQVYKPEQWNSARIEMRGPKVKVTLNGKVVQDITLDDFKEAVKRHDGTGAPPLKDRPRKGRIGFQQLSRGDSEVLIRNAQLCELTEK